MGGYRPTNENWLIYPCMYSCVHGLEIGIDWVCQKVVLECMLPLGLNGRSCLKVDLEVMLLLGLLGRCWMAEHRKLQNLLSLNLKNIELLRFPSSMNLFKHRNSQNVNKHTHANFEVTHFAMFLAVFLRIMHFTCVVRLDTSYILGMMGVWSCRFRRNGKMHKREKLQTLSSTYRVRPFRG